MAKKQKGSGTRKHGRNKRKPSAVRYTAQRRWVVNKERRAARRARQMP